MLSIFHIQEAIELDRIEHLLKDFRVLRSDLAEGDACKIKFSNRSCGVPEAIQKEIEAIVFKLNRGGLPNLDEETQLKIIDLLTLYANHLDQQTTDKENPKLAPKVKEEKVLRWLEAAYVLAKKLIPNLDALITAEKQDQLLMYKQEILSSISLMLHYLGKSRRYNEQVSVNGRLPLLTTALAMAKHLQTANDIHYYSGRIATFEMPVVFCLRDLKRYSEAEKIHQEQLQKSYEAQNLFHMIQGHVQLAEIAREQYETEHHGIEKSITHALKAIKLVEESSTENFSNHCIYFNARVAAMRAYQVVGESELSLSIANAICSEYEQNKNCGAKQWHIDEAQKIITPAFSLSVSS